MDIECLVMITSEIIGQNRMAGLNRRFKKVDHYNNIIMSVFEENNQFGVKHE